MTFDQQEPSGVGAPQAEICLSLLDHVIDDALAELTELDPERGSSLRRLRPLFYERLADVLPHVAAAYAVTNQVERTLTAASASVVLLGFQGLLVELTTKVRDGTAADADLLALNVLLQVLDATADRLYATVGEPTAPLPPASRLSASVEDAWTDLDAAANRARQLDTIGSRSPNGRSQVPPAPPAAAVEADDAQPPLTLGGQPAVAPAFAATAPTVKGRWADRPLYRDPVLLVAAGLGGILGFWGALRYAGSAPWYAAWLDGALGGLTWWAILATVRRLFRQQRTSSDAPLQLGWALAVLAGVSLVGAIVGSAPETTTSAAAAGTEAGTTTTPRPTPPPRPRPTPTGPSPWLTQDDCLIHVSGDQWQPAHCGRHHAEVTSVRAGDTTGRCQFADIGFSDAWGTYCADVVADDTPLGGHWGIGPVHQGDCIELRGDQLRRVAPCSYDTVPVLAITSTGDGCQDWAILGDYFVFYEAGDGSSNVLCFDSFELELAGVDWDRP
jgi:hypothetical protein